MQKPREHFFFFNFLQYILFCPYVDNSFTVLQIKSKFGFQTVPVVKILLNIVNILVIRDMHVERKDVVEHILYVHVCSCSFLRHCDGSQLTSGIKDLQTALASGYTHKG